MIIMQKLSVNLTKAHPDTQLKWLMLEENVLCQPLTTDVATRASQFDVITVGNYKVTDMGQAKLAVPIENLPPS